MKAKEYLLQIEKLDRVIENKLIEKERWWTLATSTTPNYGGERVQSSGSQQKMADAVCELAVIDEERSEYILQAARKRNEVLATIEELPSVEYDLLHKVYMQRKTLDDVATDYDKTYSWATTVHGRALKHLQDILDRRAAG